MDDPAIHMFRTGLERNNNSIDMALVETVQSIVLLGLSRTEFFSKAAFCVLGILPSGPRNIFIMWFKSW
jgi:hypothetical protein